MLRKQRAPTDSRRAGGPDGRGAAREDVELGVIDNDGVARARSDANDSAGEAWEAKHAENCSEGQKQTLLIPPTRYDCHEQRYGTRFTGATRTCERRQPDDSQRCVCLNSLLQRQRRAQRVARCSARPVRFAHRGCGSAQLRRHELISRDPSRRLVLASCFLARSRSSIRHWTHIFSILRNDVS